MPKCQAMNYLNNDERERYYYQYKSNGEPHVQQQRHLEETVQGPWRAAHREEQTKAANKKAPKYEELYNQAARELYGSCHKKTPSAYNYEI